jgi:methyltransferase (TIGR00027 family)
VENAGPSRTALATAYARAYHQVADQPRIFTDPLAARLLGVTADELTELSTRTVDHPGAGASDRPRRLFFAARARFAEDSVAAAVAASVRQVVILGAGLDTFAYRNPYSYLRVFEVDHPATQAWKRERLATAGIDLPETLTLVPVDIETQTLAAGLESSEFTRTEPAIFGWLGVVLYPTPSAVHTTLEYIAGQAQPVEVVFDYLQPVDNDEDREDLRARADRLASVGEPLFSYFTPDEIARQLRALGFTYIEDRTARDLIGGISTNPQNSTRNHPAHCTQAAYCTSRVLRASR